MPASAGVAPTIASILSSAAIRAPERPALVHGTARLTYGELLDRTRGVASLLAGLGLRKGDAVALLMENCPGFVTAHYALASLGAVIVPLNPQALGLPLREALELSQAVCLVTTEAVRPALRDLPATLPAIKSLVTLDGSLGPEGPAIRVATGPAFSESATVPLGKARSALERAPEVTPDDAAILFLTSGTTGKPKGILVTHRQALLGLEAWARVWAYGEETVSLMVAPFFHVVYNPLVLGVHRRGGTAAILTPLQARAALQEVEQSRATAVMGTPAFWIQVLHDRTTEGRDLSSLKTIIYGAAPMPVPVIRALRKRFPEARLYNCYGLTETCSAVSCLTSDDLAGREASVGRPHPGVEVSIRDHEHRELPPGHVGEVYCRGPNVISSYHRSPETSAARFHDGWLRTGDLGYFDRDSFLYLAGRSDDLINVAGQKVYPCDIENVLYRHPGVLDAAVMGVADDLKGQVVKAVVVPRTPGGLEVSSLKRFCLRRLPPSLVPRFYELVDELPRNASGKVLRRELARR